jgi:hypothetical protein
MEALLNYAAPRAAIDSPAINHRFRQRKAPYLGRLAWSIQFSSRRVTISDLDSVATMEDEGAWRSALSDAKFYIGHGNRTSSSSSSAALARHYWEVEVVTTAECNVMVGVCRPAVSPELGAYTTSEAWCGGVACQIRRSTCLIWLISVVGACSRHEITQRPGPGAIFCATAKRTRTISQVASGLTTTLAEPVTALVCSSMACVRTICGLQHAHAYRPSSALARHQDAAGSVTFYKNGEHLGTAFTRVSASELRPCVDMYDCGDAVRMLDRAVPPL